MSVSLTLTYATHTMSSTITKTIKVTASISLGTTTYRVDFYALRCRDRVLLLPQDLGYAGSCIRASDKTSSTHSGE
jgi:hypothetical protein